MAAPIAVFAVALLAYGAGPRVSLAAAAAAAAAIGAIVRNEREALGRGPVETVAALASVVVVGLAPGVRGLAAGGPGALGLGAAVGVLVLAARVAAQPGDGRAGLGGALLSGLALSGPGAAAALACPPLAVLALWALRRGERWPLLAPLLFTAGVGLALGAVAPLGLPGLVAHVTLAPLREAYVAAPAFALRRGTLLAAEAGEQLGVVALLLAAVGVAVTAGRDPRRAALSVWAVAAGLLVAGVPRADAGSAQVGFAVALAALAPPISVGIAALSVRLGRGALATAVAIGFIAAVQPVFAALF